MEEGEELVHDLKGPTSPVIDGGHVPQEVVLLVRIVPEPGQDLQAPLRGNENDMLVVGHHLVPEDRLPELVLESRHGRMKRGRGLNRYGGRLQRSEEGFGPSATRSKL